MSARIACACGAKAVWKASVESKIKVAHRDIYRGRSRRAAGDALFNRHTFAGRAKLLLHHRHVLVEIIVHVEPAARRVGVEYAHFDQAFLLDSDDSCEAAARCWPRWTPCASD